MATDEEVLPSSVPVGLGTQAGLAGAAGTFAMALAGFISGDRGPETVGALVSGGIILGTVVWGRMHQAAKLNEAKARLASRNLEPLTMGTAVRLGGSSAEDEEVEHADPEVAQATLDDPATVPADQGDPSSEALERPR